MARPERCELPTYSSGGCRSIQLSYGRVSSVYIDRRVASKGAAGPHTPDTSVNLTLPAVSSATVLTTASATAATAAFGFRTCFIHIQRAASHLRSVQRRDGSFRFLRIGHLDKSEAARTPCLAIRHNADPIDLSMRLKQLPQLIFRCVEVQISNKDVFQAGCLGRGAI